MGGGEPTDTAVSIENHPGGKRSACSGNGAAFGLLDEWGHSRDIAKLPLYLFWCLLP